MTPRCHCWDCLRAQGRTPSFTARGVVNVDPKHGGGVKRTGSLYPHDQGGIPANADLTGADRR